MGNFSRSLWERHQVNAAVGLRRGAIPLYYQIAQSIRSQIDAKDSKVNELLPTEEEIQRTFAVSRSTVRQALQLLSNQGLIYRIAGKGTFVAPERFKRRDFSAGSIEDIITASYDTQLKLLSRKNVKARMELARTLGLPKDSVVTEFRGIRYVDDQPFYLFTLHVPAGIASLIPQELLADTPIIALMEECCGVGIQEAHQWIVASLACGEVAKHLMVKSGDPILVIERHYVGTDKRVIGVATDKYRTDRIRQYMHLTRTDVRE